MLEPECRARKVFLVNFAMKARDRMLAMPSFEAVGEVIGSFGILHKDQDLVFGITQMVGQPVGEEIGTAGAALLMPGLRETKSGAEPAFLTIQAGQTPDEFGENDRLVMGASISRYSRQRVARYPARLVIERLSALSQEANRRLRRA